MKFFEVIEAEREDRKLSRSELARRVGCAPSYFTKSLQLGVSPTVDRAVEIAEALGVSLQYLVDRMEDEQ